MNSTIGSAIFLSNDQRSILSQLAAGYSIKDIASNIGAKRNYVKSLVRDALERTGLSSTRKLLSAVAKEGILDRFKSWSNDITLPPANPYIAPGYSSTMHANAASSDATINRGPGTSGRYEFVSHDTDIIGNEYAVPTILMDSKGALLAIGVNHEVIDQNPTVLLLDPRSLEVLDNIKLPAPEDGHVAGGIYSYIDNDNNLVLVNAAGYMQWYSNSYDLATNKGSLLLEKTQYVGQKGVVGTMPDYKGNIWYATQKSDSQNAGVSYFNKKTDRNEVFYKLPNGETVANSISSSPRGVAVASTKALYMFKASANGPVLAWRQEYENSGNRKPGQLSAGTGSSPTFFGPRTGFEFVTIANNAAPTESILVYDTKTGDLVSSTPFLTGGVNSGTENSSMAVGSSIFTPSSYGYWYPPSSQEPKDSNPSSADFAGGVQRAGLTKKVLEEKWANSVKSTALPRLSVPDGLIYTITGEYSGIGIIDDKQSVQYYFSAIDASNGREVTKYKLDGQYDQYFGHPETWVSSAYNHNTLQMVGTLDQNRTMYQGQANGFYRISGPDAIYGIGVTTDGFSFSGLNSYDRNGYTYSLNAINAADTSAWQGPTLDIQGKGANSQNFTWANAQTVLVDGAGENTLTLFGSAVNGAQENVEITINYTDGTSTKWTQSFSDWAAPRYYAGEAIYSKQAYRNRSNGERDNIATNIYAYQYGLDAGKQIESLTLPFKYNVRILDIDTSSMYRVNIKRNTFGITTPPWQVANRQGFDGKGNYYSSFLIAGQASGSTAIQNNSIRSYMPLSWNGVSFDVGELPTSNNQVGGSTGISNVLKADGTTIDLITGNHDRMYLAGAGSNGDQKGDFILNWADGSTTRWSQTFSDWRNNGRSSAPTGVAGQEVISQGLVVNQLGNITNDRTWIYGYTYDLNGRELDSITLPNNRNIGIMGITLM